MPAGEIQEALEPILVQIVEAIRRTIEYLPPELAGDILTEGGAMVGGVGEYLSLVFGYRFLLFIVAGCYLGAVMTERRREEPASITR